MKRVDICKALKTMLLEVKATYVCAATVVCVCYYMPQILRVPRVSQTKSLASRSLSSSEKGWQGKKQL